MRPWDGDPGRARGVRSVWNDEPDDAELVIVSTRADDSKAEYKPDFWPE